MDKDTLKNEMQSQIEGAKTPAPASAPAKKSSRRRTSFSRYHFRPYRDWRIILIVTAVILAGTVYYGYDLYSKVKAGDAFTVQQTKARPLVGIDTEKLQQEVEYYRARTRLFGTFKDAAPTVADPSL